MAAHRDAPDAWTSTRPVASADDNMIPIAGTFRDDNRPNTSGKRWSFAAAIGTCPMSSVHPFNAPIDDTMTATATTYAAHDPHIALAASLKGAMEVTNWSRGTTPRTTIVPNT